jgi:3-hydroxybutyryl-CoA dehydrogenase
MPGEIKNIAVIGAGELGREIALAAVVGGFVVVLEDVSGPRLDEAVRWISHELKKRVSRGETGAVGCERTEALLKTAVTVQDAIRGADLIVEAVAEEMEMKMELFTIFDKFGKPGAIFASASALSISEMSELTVVRERCIGMRFSLTESGTIDLVRTAATSEETVRACAEVGRQMGKRVVMLAGTGREGN